MHVERWGAGGRFIYTKKSGKWAQPHYAPIASRSMRRGWGGGGGGKLFHFQFCLFLPCFCVAIWRSFKTWISSYLISLKRTGYLVSTSSSLFQFGATFTKIFYLEGRWCSVGNCEALILGMQYLPTQRRFYWTVFY